MKTFKHPNIVRFYEVNRSKDHKYLNIYMEYADDNTLEHKIIEKQNEANEFGGDM